MHAPHKLSVRRVTSSAVATGASASPGKVIGLSIAPHGGSRSESVPSPTGQQIPLAIEGVAIGPVLRAHDEPMYLWQSVASYSSNGGMLVRLRLSGVPEWRS